MKATIASEWTKLWSVRSTWWALVGALALMLLSSVQVAFWVNDDPANHSASDVAVSAFAVAQLALLAVAMLAVTSEYSHRTIRATLQWTPARTRVLLAKAAVVAAVTAATGAVLAISGTVTATPMLPDPTFEVRDILAVTVSAGLLGLLAVGLGAALRGAVVTLIVLFLLLVLVPPLLTAPDISALTWIADLTPGPAGSHFLNGDTDPYPPLVGLGIAMAWSVGALVAGGAVLKRRDP